MERNARIDMTRESVLRTQARVEEQRAWVAQLELYGQHSSARIARELLSCMQNRLTAARERLTQMVKTDRLLKSTQQGVARTV